MFAGLANRLCIDFLGIDYASMRFMASQSAILVIRISHYVFH